MTDANVRIERPGTALNSVKAADSQYYVNRADGTWYQSTADVTDIVTANIGGAYRISDIGSLELNGLNSNEPMIGWSIVVFYSLATDPPRNLALFDGLDLVPPNTTVNATLSGSSSRTRASTASWA